MLLTITCTREPATDLGYLLHKNPARLHTRDLPFGRAHVFYPKAEPEECTAALLLEIDPIGLVRGRGGRGSEGGPLDQYVNDRPYTASSFMSVALGQAFTTALGGRCKDRPELVDTPLPLRVHIPVISCRGGAEFLNRLFEPLGYTVTAQHIALDPNFPEWGEGSCFTVDLSATLPVRDLLAHLYVLIPVLDDDKHYWVGEDEIEKLLRRGEGWLNSHPEKEEITNRYLVRLRRLTRQALARLVEEETPNLDEVETTQDAEEAATEERVSLNKLRLDAVMSELIASGASRVLDLGCGEGRLLKLLLHEKQFTQIAGMDVSTRALEGAADRVNLAKLPERKRDQITLFQGSLMYADPRLKEFDAAAVVEVIEHLEPYQLAAFDRVVFEHARPAHVIVTTPNVEYNVLFPTLAAGKMRHRDHRFEWTRAQFRAWAENVCECFGYTVRYVSIGEEDAQAGPPTQMAVFTR